MLEVKSSVRAKNAHGGLQVLLYWFPTSTLNGEMGVSDQIHARSGRFIRGETGPDTHRIRG